eukprot:SAG11_NODE_3431_length_2451_cov_1.535714_4_plen_48_part_00
MLLADGVAQALAFSLYTGHLRSEGSRYVPELVTQPLPPPTSKVFIHN